MAGKKRRLSISTRSRARRGARVASGWMCSLAMWLLALAACGGGPPSAGSRAAIEQWTAMEREGATPGSRTIDGRDAPTPTVQSLTIGRRSRQRVLSRGPAIDVDFAGAELTQALRLLAEAASVDLVVQDGVAGVVDATLRDVRPLDAMVAIAQAHGATVEVRGSIVIVRRAD